MTAKSSPACDDLTLFAGGLGRIRKPPNDVLDPRPQHAPSGVALSQAEGLVTQGHGVAPGPTGPCSAPSDAPPRRVPAASPGCHPSPPALLPDRPVRGPRVPSSGSMTLPDAVLTRPPAYYERM